jgi:transcriptional regulator with XRE-family HTH domain
MRGIGSDTIASMQAGDVLRIARERAGLSQRELAKRAGTSHSTLSAYERGRVVPSVETLDRLLRSAGFESEVRLERRVREFDGLNRGEELVRALELASQFPRQNAGALARSLPTR